MLRNGPWAAALVPLIPWVLGTGAITGGSIWGWYRLQQYREETEQELEQRQQAALSAQEESEARTRQMLAQLNPLFIAGTIVTTGLGAFIMVRGMRRERLRRHYEIVTTPPAKAGGFLEHA